MESETQKETETGKLRQMERQRVRQMHADSDTDKLIDKQILR